MRKIGVLVTLILLVCTSCNSSDSANSTNNKMEEETTLFPSFILNKSTEITTRQVIEVLEEDQQLVEYSDRTIEIPDLNIISPILEGVDDDTIKVSVGHFPETADVGEGNFAVIGHASEIWDCVFNNLKNIEAGMQIIVTKDEEEYTYYTTSSFVVEPNEVWVLDDFGDDRITIITCTDGGLRRQVIVGKHMSEAEYMSYISNIEKTKRRDVDNLSSALGDICISQYFNRNSES